MHRRIQSGGWGQRAGVSIGFHIHEKLSGYGTAGGNRRQSRIRRRLRGEIAATHSGNGWYTHANVHMCFIAQLIRSFADHRKFRNRNDFLASEQCTGMAQCEMGWTQEGNRKQRNGKSARLRGSRTGKYAFIRRLWLVTHTQFVVICRKSSKARV